MSGASELAKNLTRAVSADAVVLLVSMLVTIIVPRFLGVAEYGYWQLYLFYGAYVQIAQMGWSDGILVRKAGTDFSSRLSQWFTAQLLLQLFVVSIVALAVAALSIAVEGGEERFILVALAVSVVISNCRFMCLRLFQATRQMRLYSMNITFDRVVFAALVFGLLAAGIREFELLVIGSLVARTVALAVSLWASRMVLTLPVRISRGTFRESTANIYSGARTLLAVLSGLFTIGVVRLVVERSWGVEAFANVSLTLNIAGLVSLFVSGLSFALLPYLRRSSPGHVVGIYCSVRSLVSCLLITSLLLYFPASVVFRWWLPQFPVALDLLFLLFPIVVFDGRTSLLTVTYLRSFRLETDLLMVNIFTLVLSAVLASVVAEFSHDLQLTVAVVLIAVAVRSLALEYVLARHCDLRIGFRACVELLWVTIFVGLAASLEDWVPFAFMTLVLVYYLLLRKDVHDAFGIVKRAILQ